MYWYFSHQTGFFASFAARAGAATATANKSFRMQLLQERSALVHPERGLLEASVDSGRAPAGKPGERPAAERRAMLRCSSALPTAGLALAAAGAARARASLRLALLPPRLVDRRRGDSLGRRRAAAAPLGARLDVLVLPLALVAPG